MKPQFNIAKQYRGVYWQQVFISLCYIATMYIQSCFYVIANLIGIQYYIIAERYDLQSSKIVLLKQAQTNRICNRL